MMLTSAALVGCGTTTHVGPTRASTAEASAPDRISPVPMTTPPGFTQPAQGDGPGCDEPPARIVEMINAGFTNGEHIEDVAALDGDNASTYVAGNIYEASGARGSSHNAWLYRDGAIYALTKDARRHTLFTDGRGMIPDDFFSGADWELLGQCINASARAAGK